MSINESTGILLGNKGLSIKDIHPNPTQYLIHPDALLKPKPVTNPGVISAILDTGIMKHHPQLDGLVIKEIDFTNEGPEDMHGHGTLVALVMVAAHHRMAQLGESMLNKQLPEPDIGILNVKVANKHGQIDRRNLIKGIKWSVENGAGTVNISLGYTGTLEAHKELCELIASYKNKNVQFFAAAGNFGPEVTVFPAGCPENVFSVGAHDWAGQPLPTSGSGKIFTNGQEKLTLFDTNG